MYKVQNRRLKQYFHYVGKFSLQHFKSPAAEPVFDQSYEDALEDLVMRMTAKISLISVSQT